MLAKIQVRIVYLVIAIVVSFGAGVGAMKGYDSFMSARHPERYYYGMGITLNNLTIASVDDNPVFQKDLAQEALVKDREMFGVHGLIAYTNANPFDKEGRELSLKGMGFSPEEITELLRPIQ